MVALREYQTKTIVGLRDGLVAGLKRQIAYLPTGGGKTRVAASLLSNVTTKGKRAAFICNRIELVQQASEALSSHGIHHGVIQGDNSHTTHANVLVCSIQTLARRGIPPIDFAIIDECHTCAGSDAYKNLFSRLNNIPIVGLSATPFAKGLGKHYPEMFGGMFEAIVVGATISDLIADGFLVDVDIYAPGEPDLSGVRAVAGDYEEKGLGEAVDRPKLIGDIVAHYLKLAFGKRTIVFATNVAHSKHIVGAFQDQGIDAWHVDGYMLEDERRPLIDAFKRGEFPILSNCSLLAEGFDCPETEAIILARPTKSLIRYIQMAGRALRPHHSKEKALILDHSGTVRRLGFPTDDLPLILDDGKPKPKSEKENLPKVCKSCFAVYPRTIKKCPCCGFEPVETPKEIIPESGQLVKLERKGKDLSMDDKQTIYSAFLTWAHSKGFKEGAAYWKYKDMVGIAPANNLKKIQGPMIESVEGWLKHDLIKYLKGKEKAPQRNQHECPKCHAVGEYVITPSAGPHGNGAKCKCGTHWWLKKEAA